MVTGRIEPCISSTWYNISLSLYGKRFILAKRKHKRKFPLKTRKFIQTFLWKRIFVYSVCCHTNICKNLGIYYCDLQAYIFRQCECSFQIYSPTTCFVFEKYIAFCKPHRTYRQCKEKRNKARLTCPLRTDIVTISFFSHAFS